MKESRIPGSDGKKAKKLSVKLWAKGVVEKTTIFEGSENTQYYIRHSGQLMYGKLDFLNCAFGLVPPELDGYESTLDAPAFDIKGINSFFLLNRITQRSFYKKNGDIANGSRKAKRIHPDTFLAMNIIAPSIEEQIKISSFLAILENRIEKQRQFIDALKSYKRGVLSVLFPQDGDTVPCSRFGGFDRPWTLYKFSDFTWASGTRNKDNLDLEPYAITNEHGFIRQSEAHEEFGYMKDTDRRAYNIVKPHSFAYNPARINVGSIGYYDGSENVIVSSLYEVFQTTDFVDDRFLWHWFKSDEFPKWIEKLQEGSVRLYFYYDKLCECQILLPSVVEQRRIANYLDSIDMLIESNQRVFKSMLSVRRSLLQQMFI